MWTTGWRNEAWSALGQPFDVIIIGGGITGAGILNEAARIGLRALLVEQDDFASGTSSRSSKLVHGGFRYLKNAQIRLTFESVRERERLLREGRGLITPLGFLLASYKRDAVPAWALKLGLVMYDLLAFKWGHRQYDALDMRELCPPLCDSGLAGGFRYFDAQTDDARLVLRLVQEGVQAGGSALNYARAIGLLRLENGQVCGVALQDQAPGSLGRTAEVKGAVVINATGAWADDLRLQVGGRARLRKLRGSHLIFPATRLPLTRAVSFMHPRDGRFCFAFPWEGVTLVGTTDVDHADLRQEPRISPDETGYLMEAVQCFFPDLALEQDDIQGSFSGVRPVIDTGKADPSKESREHVLWRERGLLTVAGGKLTTFRCMAVEALQAARHFLPEGLRGGRKCEGPILESLQALEASDLSPAMRLRLAGRHGAETAGLIAASQPGELGPIPGTQSPWAELRWAARAEGVVHLADLLLRRVRLGLLLPQGGIPLLERIRPIVQPELGWDDARWSQEAAIYTNQWKKCYDALIE